MGSGAVDWEKYVVAVPGLAQLIAQEKQRPSGPEFFASLATVDRD